MGCIISIIGIITPRLLMILIFIFSRWFERAYDSALWPVLGFFFMPYTTLAHMAAMLNNNHTLSGWWMFLFIVAIIVDVSNWGGSGHTVRVYRTRKRMK